MIAEELDGDNDEAIETRLLLEAIHAKYGYDLRGYAPKSMRRRVRDALARSGCKHLGELQHRVLVDSAFFAHVLNQLTVRVSDMFRDPNFYEVFRSRVFPILRTYPILKIWHGGCGRGEEVYSTAILLLEAGLYERSQIYATDLNAQTVEQAKEGVYSAEHLPIFFDNYQRAGGISQLSSYFTEGYGRIAVRDSLRKNILFFQHNLVSDHVFGEMNVIFCRNVMIYFGKDLRRQVLSKFTQSLCPRGFLCLGSSEHMDAEFNERFSAFSEAERIYRYKA